MRFFLVFTFLFLAETSALAQATAAPAGPSILEQFFPFILMFIVAYFLLLRPQQKRARAHAEFLANIKRGDSVLTAGGILGKIEGVTEKFVTLEVADGVRIRILKSQIAALGEEGGK